MSTKYQPVVNYAQHYWDSALAANYKPQKRTLGSMAMHIGHIRLPYPAVSPNDHYFAHTQFYWDTYFTILGLVVSGREQEARYMVDNLCFLFEKFGYIPARNSWTSLGRSQPPFLTSMAFEVYDKTKDTSWLDKVMDVAQREYSDVWTSGRRYDKNTKLSRYNPLFWKKHLTVYESGWDSSVRYSASSYKHLVPVDLNCQLYQYEVDFARYANLKGDKAEAANWKAIAEERKTQIQKYFWDKESGFYYDYNLKTGQPETVKSLAGFYALWCGIASNDQAALCLKKLALFEHDGGLANSEKVEWRKRQWDYPNGWAPQQYLVYRALIRYGFATEAKRVAEKWLDLNLGVFLRTNKLWEKYDVVRSHIGWKGRYPTQAGFAWTNAIFLRLLKELEINGR